MWDYQRNTLMPQYRPHCLPKNHSHHTQSPGISTRMWKYEEMSLVPASVTIMLMLCGSVCLSCPWGVPWSQSPPYGDMVSCWLLFNCTPPPKFPQIWPTPPFCLSPQIFTHCKCLCLPLKLIFLFQYCLLHIFYLFIFIDLLFVVILYIRWKVYFAVDEKKDLHYQKIIVCFSGQHF